MSGFPEELVLDQAAQLSGSYAINYSSNLNQYTANWMSDSQIDELYNRYVSYFASRGWVVVNSSTNAPNFRGIYVVTSTADANVVMNSGPDGLKVTVSYVKK